MLRSYNPETYPSPILHASPCILLALTCKLPLERSHFGYYAKFGAKPEDLKTRHEIIGGEDQVA